MYNNNIFQDFVNNVLVVGTPQVHNETLGFVKNFSESLEVRDKDIDSLLKEINSYNSASTPNSKVLIPSNILESLK